MFVLIWIICKIYSCTLFGSHVLMALALYIAFILSDISGELGGIKKHIKDKNRWNNLI